MEVTINKQNIRSLSENDLMLFFEKHGEKSFRARQISEWMWKKSAVSFDEMTNLSKNIRSLLDKHFEINAVKVKSTQVSEDKTIKSAFKLYDDKVVEGVLIPHRQRMTACISSQVGCSLTCKFCATGKLKRLRNLNADEIYDQVTLIGKQAMEIYGRPLSNIVYMGMGEPLLNYKNVLGSIDKITSPNGLGMSPKRITVSTAGIAKMIKKLGDDKVKFNLALSLHAANDHKRNQIMPVNEQNSLNSLAEALKHFHRETDTWLTYEYIVFKDFNDQLTDAKELSKFCSYVPCKVNIIEYNPIGDNIYKQADSKKIDEFVAFLESKNIITNVRRSRGKDIDAACGQLANKMKAKEQFHNKN